MWRRLAHGAIMAVALAGCDDASHSASFADGVAAYDRGDAPRAARIWRALGEPTDGSADAQFNLGVLHTLGAGVPQDDRRAAAWFRRAAEQGHAEALTALGNLYAEGRGVARDEGAARTWFRAAAARGDRDAQHNLGLMSEQGRGGPSDDVRALMWYILAGSTPHRLMLAERMTQADRARAERLAEACRMQGFHTCD